MASCVHLRFACIECRQRHLAATTDTRTIETIHAQTVREERERGPHLARRNRISTSQFVYNFNLFSESDALLYFRFKKADVTKTINAVAWPSDKTRTHCNRFLVTPILATCIILRRLASPGRWWDLERFVGKYASQMSEFFWEGIEHLLQAREDLIKGPM